MSEPNLTISQKDALEALEQIEFRKYYAYKLLEQLTKI